ncbi:Festuclavine dehydrogenase subunit FgaOx3 OS=Neosartorya fumigata (strain ATCC MYA-4609 / Af293 / CBS 101355 / FGSC A1100) GN=fgaOx3 PE=3 SV=1 [Rhizoctonia solani AG-1 IB]|uniref:Festuclavine dehydrogenase subunit FgaOx3 n=1 Tax=Thanatephorus cucumeris (strain AG1-IB / isolate 7/3/14) TaxID=1108050 RepID=M5BM69_THACB|nr:NADPH dehydrogenase 3 [Rhizoctonia solani AG-1 IB]CEL55799.1 Festuclavine dehydrogenase subunit FgaOx3 OS=Neosartorya fumigata (strain ATCC MYA-4609 / Af293 / CBS 101355 / FGSC A1100) GN=fgaOx3 PE=3 SV=1 [Rhizoctonia solani AG-1 IB]
MPETSRLFDTLRVGNLTLAHRIIMAPMTRLRGTPDGVVKDITAEYYSQRSTIPGTLLIAEAVSVAAEAAGFPNFPGFFNDAQVAGWKKVVDAVHANGSYIYLQIGALGRMGYPEVLDAGGHPYVSSSPTKLGSRSRIPAELSQSEIRRYVGLYAEAARRAVHEAGFDGVEIHACNGSLIEQFIQDVVNRRSDNYGGSIVNRTRFLFEVVQAVVDEIGVNRTGIRFSPWSKGQDMGMKNPVPTYTHIIAGLAEKHPELAYIHMIEPGINSADDGTTQELDEGVTASNDFAFQIWSPRTYLTGGGYNHKSAPKTADKLENTAIVIGRLFISNPDLPLRIKAGLEPVASDPSTYYSAGPESVKGYTDYPLLPTQVSA